MSPFIIRRSTVTEPTPAPGPVPFNCSVGSIGSEPGTVPGVFLHSTAAPTAFLLLT